MFPTVGDRVNGGYIEYRDIHPEYVGLYDCMQSASDINPDVIVDRSGKNAHAVRNSLTAAELWSEIGWAASLAETGHAATVPLANWPFRFGTHDLLIAGRQKMATPGASVRVFGNGVSLAAGTGFNLLVTASGAMQFNALNSGTGVNSASTATSGFTPFADANPHSWLWYFSRDGYTLRCYIDGQLAINSSNNISEAVFKECDANVQSGPAIGGRPPTSAASLHAVKSSKIHILALQKARIPSNLNLVALQLHRYPGREIGRDTLKYY